MSVKRSKQKEYDDAAESKLIELSIQGDSAAFESLVGMHEKWAYRLAYRLSEDHCIADEISQEAFVNLYCSLPRFRGDAKLKTYLTRIIINIWRQHLRRVYRRQSFTQALLRRQKDRNNLPRELKRGETMDKIGEAVARLTRTQRKVFVLKYLMGLSIAEIAPVVGCREGTVKAHIFKAVGNLRKRLQ